MLSIIFKELKKKYGKGRERKTEIRSFENIDATKVAVSNVKLYANSEEGFVGTGLKEIAENEETPTFSKLTELLKPNIIERESQTVKVKPEIVLMIAYEEIQKSPSYGSGFALRFPRVIAIRNDKPVTDIASIEDIYDMYDEQ